MALPTSGPISLLQLALEYGGSAPHSLNEYYGASPGVPASGTISLVQFLGKKKQNYRWWRLFIETTRSTTVSVIIEELELRATPGGADLTSPTTPISASAEYVGFRPSGAIDDGTGGGTGTSWRAGAPGANPTNQWLLMDLGTVVTVRELAIKSTTTEASKPILFRLEGSNDAVNFTTVQSFYVPPTDDWGNMVWKAFTVG